MGYPRIKGELRKLGIDVGATTIRRILKTAGPRDGSPPLGSDVVTVPQRTGSRRPRNRLLHGRDHPVEDALRAVLHRARHGEVHVAGVTEHPDSAWVTQQARNLVVDGALVDTTVLIRDRDAKCSGPFDEVFRTGGVEVVRTPYRSPQANAFSERWVRTVRSECLDWTLVRGRRHLDRVARIYAEHYNRARPHRGLQLDTPQAAEPGEMRPSGPRSVRRRDVLGGLIHEYAVAA